MNQVFFSGTNEIKLKVKYIHSQLYSLLFFLPQDRWQTLGKKMLTYGLTQCQLLNSNTGKLIVLFTSQS